jgi:hypothetical protein
MGQKCGRQHGDQVTHRIGIGVKPITTNASVSQPSTIRNRHSGSVSLAVGGCSTPPRRSSRIMTSQLM